MTQTYLVVFEKGPHNYSGFAPDIPGCISVGDTIEEMRAHYREALELWVEAAVELHQAIPEPVTRYVQVPLPGEPDVHAEYAVEWITIDIPETSSSFTQRAA